MSCFLGLYTNLDKTLISGIVLFYCSWNCQVKMVTVSMATKLCRTVVSLEGFIPIKSHGSWIMWSRDITWQIITNKSGRVVTHNEELRPIQSHNPSITCSCEVTWHSNVMSPIALNQWKPYMAWWWLTVWVFHSWPSHMTI